MINVCLPKWAIPLGSRLEKIADEHKKKEAEDFAKKFHEEENAAIDLEIANREHLNVLLQHERQFVPTTEDDLDNCRKAFNLKLAISANDQKKYLRALTGYYNFLHGTDISGPDDRGSTIPLVRRAIINHISS